jgi:CHAT domain-containing protein
VWWCPVGTLNALPIHAAGVYNGLAQDSVDEYLVSSYTPTLSALHRLLDEDASLPRPVAVTKSPTVLLVAQPNATDLPWLPNAQREAELIRALIPPEYFANRSDIDSHGISVDTALNGASSAHIIHLACHGHQDQDNPLNSGFDLEDGRLTLGQLMRTTAPHAQLAYLSACESAAIDQTRPDEGLNLVGAMIFAGFKSVIGTMW